MTALEYPQVKLRDGQTFRLRFSMKAIRLLKQWKLNNPNATDQIEAWAQLAGQVAATAYRESPDGKMEHAGLTLEDVVKAYDDDPELWEMKSLRDAVNLAVDFRMQAGDDNSQPASNQQTGS